MVKISAYFFSVIFHPLLMPTYMLVLLLLINPYLFGVHGITDSGFLLAQVVLTTFILPIFSLLLLRQLDFVSSFELKKREDRIAPYMITGMFYIGLVVFFIKTPGQIPVILSIGFLGATIALWLTFIINLFTKLSAHTVGVGGLVGLVALSTFYFDYSNFLLDLGALGIFSIKMKTLLMLCIFIAGLVGSARLLLKAHTTQQIYVGYFVGFIPQFLALNFLS